MTGPWAQDSLIEDFELTIVLKNLGWDVRAGQAYAYTDVPKTLRGLWRQRLRWGRGGVDECRRYGWTRGTRRSICAYGVYGVGVLARIGFVGTFTVALAFGLGWSFAPWTLIFPAVSLIDRLMCMWRLPDRTWRDVALTCLVLAQDLYGLWLEACTARAIWLSLTGARGSW